MLNKKSKIIRNVILVVLAIVAFVFAVTHIKLQSKEEHDNLRSSVVAASMATNADDKKTEGSQEKEISQAEITIEMTAEKTTEISSATNQSDSVVVDSSDSISETVYEPVKTDEVISQQPSQSTSTEAESITVTIQVRCDAATAIKDSVANDGVKAVIPDNGVILGQTTVTVAKDANVYDILADILNNKGIAFVANSSHTYISSINQLSEKMLGMSSGWTYLVNGDMPMRPAVYYIVSDGDFISFEYVCG